MGRTKGGTGMLMAVAWADLHVINEFAMGRDYSVDLGHNILR